MINKQVETALNKQINAEIYSMYLYKAMSAYFVSENLKGAAQWLDVQAKEEWGHAMRIYDYIHDRGGKVELTAIDAPPNKWKSLLDAFTAALDHEKKVTVMINELMDLAIKNNDHATVSFLKWFVDEQVEEEAQTDEIVRRLAMAEKSTGALLYIEHELGKRKGE